MKVSDAQQTVRCYLHAHLIFFLRLFLSPILRSMQDSHSQEMRSKGKQPAHFTSSQLLRRGLALHESQPLVSFYHKDVCLYMSVNYFFCHLHFKEIEEFQGNDIAS